MRILVLCEGDGETRDSWSGTSQGLIAGLRGLGHEVKAADCDLYGLRRWVGAGSTFSPSRRRWWTRYHLNAVPFRLRSGVATRHVEQMGGWADVILQFGATFLPTIDATAPYVLYCDSNIHLSELGASAGLSEAAQLTHEEISAIRGREAGVYSRARLIFTMSRMVANTFMEGFGVAPESLITVHAGINTIPDAIGGGEEDGRPTILFVGRAFERKGGQLLLQAFELLRQKVPDASLVIVGPTSDPAPGAPGVRYLGFLNPDDPADRTKLLSAYHDADVFCLPTRFEPLGIVYLEAMAFGVPCVGPRAWAVPEMIAHGKTGLLVDDDEPESWAAALHELVVDPERGRRMGEEGRQRVEAYYTWDRVARSISDALNAELARS